MRIKRYCYPVGRTTKNNRTIKWAICTKPLAKVLLYFLLRSCNFHAEVVNYTAAHEVSQKENATGSLFISNTCQQGKNTMQEIRKMAPMTWETVVCLTDDGEARVLNIQSLDRTEITSVRDWMIGSVMALSMDVRGRRLSQDSSLGTCLDRTSILRKNSWPMLRGSLAFHPTTPQKFQRTTQRRGAKVLHSRVCVCASFAALRCIYPLHCACWR